MLLHVIKIRSVHWFWSQRATNPKTAICAEHLLMSVKPNLSITEVKSLINNIRTRQNYQDLSFLTGCSLEPITRCWGAWVAATYYTTFKRWGSFQGARGGLQGTQWQGVSNDWHHTGPRVFSFRCQRISRCKMQTNPSLVEMMHEKHAHMCIYINQSKIISASARVILGTWAWKKELSRENEWAWTHPCQ